MYDFHDLRARKELPDDVNSFVIDELDKVFKSKALILEIRECEKKRRYCELAFQRGAESVRICFQAGIATSFWLKKIKVVIGEDKTIKKDELISIELSVKNKLIKIKSKNSKGEN